MLNDITPQYVCFNQKTGEIFSIGPAIEEGYQYIQIPKEQAELFQTQKENMVEYEVAYNRSDKKFVLKKNTYVTNEPVLIEVIPVDESVMYDLLLTVDIASQRCYINTGTELFDVMETTNINFEKEVTFSFTKKGDPHILYDTVTFNINEPREQAINLTNSYSIYAISNMTTCMYKEI